MKKLEKVIKHLGMNDGSVETNSDESGKNTAYDPHSIMSHW